MNVLALDFGLKRIGVAVGSTESGIAFPRDVLANGADLSSALEKLITSDQVGKILLGLPIRRDGSLGDIESELTPFLLLVQSFGVPVERIDERFTSKIAEAKLRDIGMKERDQRAVSDSTAAQVMLQEWLDLNAG